MKISLRNMPSEVERAIAETSRTEGISLNKATLTPQGSSMKKPTVNDDFDEFLGAWNGVARDETGHSGGNPILRLG